MKKGFVKGYVSGIVTVLVFGILIYTGVNYLNSRGNESISSIVSDKLDYLKTYIDAYYLEDINDADLETGIYKGFVNALGDPYSTYYTQEEYNEIVQSQSGEYCGIGVGVSQETDTGIINIITVYEGSPAEEAGMKAEDVLYKVEDKEVTGENLDKVVSEIRGDEGTKVKLTVYRTSTKEYIDLEVERKTIDIPTISYEMVDEDNKIGYIRIIQFDEKTDEHFSEAIKELQKQGMKSVIFDVRSNPGGLYDTVCNMLDEILPEGTLVYTLDKYGVKEEKTSDEECLDMPMVVLTNGNSASASEIFAGAVQDFEAGKIIGTQTFGKGIVQSLFGLNDGSSIKLTVSKYYTPKGVNIHGKGITPDIEIELDSESEEDVQLNKAIEELSK